MILTTTVIITTTIILATIACISDVINDNGEWQYWPSLRVAFGITSPQLLIITGMEKFEENAAKSRFPINVADAELIIQLSLSTIVRDADISFSV